MEMESTHQMIDLNRKIIRGLTVVGSILTLLLGIWVYRSGFFEAEGSFKAVLEGMGIYGPIAFLLIQIIQVVYPVIPGGITLVIAQLVFGPLWGFVYSFVGVLVGSVINFLLARKYGKTFVRAFVSEASYLKYYTWLTKGKRFDWLLASAFALPGFPDDFLCMVAGLTKMSMKRFMAIFMLFKPVTLYIYGIGGASLLTWLFLNVPTIIKGWLAIQPALH
ncbi:Hypothetical protein Tpal_2601 [Trichococcus palustris]|uniref:TVP38/TMEM64 family membrane protein n=2 Tax=Trichococcus palustris TaxID=140314 RepID=A0A143YXM8_9LACT|nr:Hypothetical protein Tpal_2601 [Trichococcus palustris]SFL07821.1 Uncharacterized membrane protein YdjX, TVP38/TMEM64 family, SNARE-associated domain [Trichococcus palustris]